ncbi:MAG: hypothetical protein ABFC96_12775 [Thermoguttaceae bacterium]
MKTGDCNGLLPGARWAIMTLAAALTLGSGEAFARSNAEKPPATPRKQAASRDALSRADYSVGEALSRIQEERKLDRAKSKTFLVRALKLCLASADRAYVQAHPNTVLVDETTIAWAKDRENTLEVDSTPAGHRRIRETLDAIHRRGTAAMTIQVYFLTTTGDEIKRLGFSGLISDPLDNKPSDSAFEPELLQTPSTTGTRNITETVSPLLYKIVETKDEREILSRWERDRMTNAIEFPKLTVFNGQTARLSDVAQTPVVVGVKNGQPQIRVLQEGTTIQLQPAVDEKGNLTLRFVGNFAKITKVETLQLASSSGGKPVTVQVPETAATRLQGELELPWSTRLILDGTHLLTSGPNRPELCLVIRVDKATELLPEN